MRPLSSLSYKVLKKPAKLRGFAEFSVLQKWPEIFPSYAQFMRPISLKKGVLKVATNSGSAATNLRMQGDYLVARINQYFGYNAVKKIQYTIRSFENDANMNLPLLEKNKEASEYAKVTCKDIEDKALKESFERLAAMVHLEKKIRK